jgi:hypothetical protein
MELYQRHGIVDEQMLFALLLSSLFLARLGI